MTDIRTRLENELRDHCLGRLAVDIARVLLSLPDIVIIERGELANAIAGGIRGYADGESQAYSYHGDGSALEAMHNLERDAPNIAQYIFTHSSLAVESKVE